MVVGAALAPPVTFAIISKPHERGTHMAIEVMSRFENKYLLTTEAYEKIRRGVEDYAVPDIYNINNAFYTIANIYYDTNDNYLIRTSLNKPQYKEKLRLRSYGVPTEFDTVYAEIKKKCKGMVNKRRTGLPLPFAYELMETYSLGDIADNAQIAQEVMFALHSYKPRPKVYIAYDRRAYTGESDLRITFDTNIRTRRHNLRLDAGDYGEPLVSDGVWLMETKTDSAIPIWLARLLSENSAYSTSFSKYGTEYKKFIQKERGEDTCLNPFLTPQTTQLLPQSHGKTLSQQLA